MAFLENSTYNTIKEAIFYSTGNNGLIAVYKDAKGSLTYFINGKPTMKFNSKKDAV
jgi:hypothetical protein